jgi:tetratricopeptide (TPR) repeat protein
MRIARTRRDTMSRHKPSPALRQPQSAKIQDLLTRAVRAHQAGQLDQAKQLYLDILAIDVRHAKSLYGLGLIAHQIGNPEAAARMIERAIASSPREAAYYASLGAALLDIGKPEDALAAYRKVLELNPDHEEAHFHAAKILLDLHRHDEARPHFDRAIALAPNNADTHNNLGLLLARQNKPEEAAARYQRALELNPNFIEALNNLGNLLCVAGKLDEARQCFERAITLDPARAEAQNNLGVVLRDLGRFDEAAARHQRALELRPDYPDALTNLGIVLRDLGRLDESLVNHERALALRPDYAEAFNNLGNTQRSMGRLDEARKSYERSLELNRGSVEARWNLSLTALHLGDFETGWREYEIRYRRKRNVPRGFAQPLWRGEALNGLRILLHAEQGLGDSLQFLRYVPVVIAAGGRVILDVQPTLVRLAAQTEGIETLVATGDPLPEFDLHCPLMSLPRAFSTRLDSIPAQVPYLRAPEDARQNAAQLVWPAGALRVGLVWSGNPKYPEDRWRSIALGAFAPILEIGGTRFYSLQLGPAASQLAENGASVVDLQSAIHDMADTAALIERLDLVITVDTAAAHLGGALGQPTWLLLPFAPDWRWLAHREDSPWYPTMRLFRQPRFGEWSPVLERVRTELTALAASHSGS